MSLKERFIEIDKTLDRQEQYSRRNCLLVHGVNEKNNEGTDQAIINIIKNDVGEEITIHDIENIKENVNLIIMFHDQFLLSLKVQLWQ